MKNRPRGGFFHVCPHHRTPKHSWLAFHLSAIMTPLMCFVITVANAELNSE
jgi:hypothetical protein